MKLGDVLRKERGRRKMTEDDMSSRLALSIDTYRELEDGASPIEEWGPKLAQIAIKLSVAICGGNRSAHIQSLLSLRPSVRRA
jgi:transcriptional regulator with XRE-family HTH domain